MKPFKPGDRVKLTERGARIRSSSYLQRRTYVDWPARRGTVTGVGHLYVYIRWDGCKALDYEPHVLIEKDEPGIVTPGKQT